jgi:hypothetical protein
MRNKDFREEASKKMCGPAPTTTPMFSIFYPQNIEPHRLLGDFPLTP